MGLFKSFVYGNNMPAETNFVEYRETFAKQPVFVSCDTNFRKTLPNPELNVCVKVQMAVSINVNNPQLISDIEAAHLADIRTILNQHIGGRFVGQGVVASQEIAFLVFYIPERSAKNCKRMLQETFSGSFRHSDFSVTYDPNGNEYLKFLYPNALQFKQIDNNKILRTLKGYGDDGKTPRPVLFHIIFPNRPIAINFYTKAGEKGFEYVSLTEEPAPEGLVLPRFHLVLKKEIPFNIELLDLIDGYLLKLAEAFQGEYKSLETDIVED